MLKEKPLYYKILLLLDFAMYLFMVVFLIVEAAMKGPESSQQSSSVTDVVINITNAIAHEEVLVKTEKTTYTIRKLIGHYSTFLVLGFFSTFFYFFVSDRKRKLLVIINFIQGVLLAFITEFIQLFTPGRYGALKDVLIDSGGFLTSGIILTIIIGLILYKRNKVPQKA